MDNCKEEYKKHAQVLDIIKTACTPKDLLLAKNIDKALKKATLYGFDKELLIKSLKILKTRLSND